MHSLRPALPLTLLTPALTALTILAACSREEKAGETPLPAPTEEVPAMTLELTSTAFSEGQPIPARYTCTGEDISPPLA